MSDCLVQLAYCSLKKGVKPGSGRCENVLFLMSNFSSLFLQAFQQSTAASLTSPRSGNPGYLVGKPLLALTGDTSHSVSFLELGGILKLGILKQGGLLQPNE